MAHRLGTLLALGAGWWATCPAVHACATCSGKTDSRMADGMNAGIAALLLIIFLVLGAIAGFFTFLAHRAALQSAASESESASSGI